MSPSDLQSTISRSHPSFRPEELRDDQKSLWSVLPAAYREFLSRFNGGIVEEGDLCFDTPIPFFKGEHRVRDHQTDCVVELFGLQPPGETREPHDLAELKREHDAEDFLPSGIIAIAECLGSSLLCLSTRSQDHGAIYYWDYYWRYPWCRPFFDPRIEAAERAFPDIAEIRADPRHPRQREAIDVLNYATLVRLADQLPDWLARCRRGATTEGPPISVPSSSPHHLRGSKRARPG